MRDILRLLMCLFMEQVLSFRTAVNFPIAVYRNPVCVSGVWASGWTSVCGGGFWFGVVCVVVFLVKSTDRSTIQILIQLYCHCEEYMYRANETLSASDQKRKL